MSARTARLIKETRSLLWPWIVVTSLGVTRALAGDISLGPVHLTQLALLGAFIGIPLLATLPFGVEFQHGTLPVLLSQPVDRTKIWMEKVITATAFAASAAALYYLSWHVAVADDRPLEWTWIVFSVAAVSSAAYWTLVGRSTITGLALNLIAAGLLIGAALYFMTITGVAEVNAAVAIFSVVISGCMFWLGHRKFIRFESTGAAAGPDVMERGLGGLDILFRSTRTNASMNVMRRELRLLSPAWLVAVLAVLFMICLTPVRLMTMAARPALSTIVASLAATVIGISLGLVPLLAGILSVGEERTAGTQIWNLILPLSKRRQWLLKLMAGLLTCGLCQIFVLFAAWVFGRWAFGAELNLLFNSTQNRVNAAGLSTVVFITAFWCACAVRGTVRASLLTFPVAATIGAAGTIGFRIGHNLGFPALNSLLIATFHPYPFSQTVFFLVRAVLPSLFVVPLFAVAVVQSYRLFRYDLTNEQSTVARRLVSLMIVGLLCGVSIYAATDFSVGSYRLDAVLNEVYDAAAKLATTTLPIHLSPTQLEQTSPLSTVTRLWLRHAAVTVLPTELASPTEAKASPFYLSVTFQSGVECRAARMSTLGLHAVGKIYRLCKDSRRSKDFVPTIFMPADVAQTMRISEASPLLASDIRSAVTLRVFIQADGTVRWAYPLSGDEPFTSAAVNDVQHWRYQPMRILGWPSNAMTEVTINFP